VRFEGIPAFAAFLSRMGADKPVVDQTGLKGNFAIDVDMLKVEEISPKDGDGMPTFAARFDALTETIEDTLGLKLVSTKAQVDVFAIDHAERVTEN